MRIHQIVNGVDIFLSNQEKDFIESHQDRVYISSLDESESWTAQNLVRKGVYYTDKQGRELILNRGSGER